MNAYKQPELTWIKATRSVGGGACVEFASAGGRVAIRDSKDPSVHFLFERSRVALFIERVKHSEYDDLIDG